MFIDIHVHTARFRGEGLHRPNGSRNPTPEELLALLDASGIDRAVVMCAISPECGYALDTPEEVLGICREFPDRLIPYASLDPRMLTNSARSDFFPLLQHYKQAGAKGIGEYMPNMPFDDPLNMNVFKQVEAAGLPLTFHIANRLGGMYGCYDDLGLPRLEQVLRACPNLILLGHSQPFWAEISGTVTDETRGGYPSGPVQPGRLVELMRTYPNLHGDLSAGSGYNAISRDQEFGYQFLEEFQDRLYFGTDICNVGQRSPIVAYLRQIAGKGHISQGAYEKITWRNAARLLKLDL